MAFLQEFKTFVMRGNVVDLAVGVIIGVAFGKIVTSLVNDVIMPPIGVLLGGVDFSSLQVTIHGATADTPAVVMRYGAFINTVVDFLIVALSVFFMIKVVNALVPKPVKEATTKQCPECLMDIPLAAKRCGHCTTILKDLK